jgi:hypothetical protein
MGSFSTGINLRAYYFPPSFPSSGNVELPGDERGSNEERNAHPHLLFVPLERMRTITCDNPCPGCVLVSPFS